MQISRIKNIYGKLNEYEKIIKIKLEYDLDILTKLAVLDAFMIEDSDRDIVREDIIDPEEQVPLIGDYYDDENKKIEFEPVKPKRGRPKKKKN